LTYVYADSTAVLGPLATYAPRGWEIVRIAPDADALKPSSDDLEALADAVREAARPRYLEREAAATTSGNTVEVARRGHLRVLVNPDQ